LAKITCRGPRDSQRRDPNYHQISVPQFREIGQIRSVLAYIKLADSIPAV
jgi:hypothetical protein